LEFVHPTDGNKAVYSTRLYELLLRASTEFESLCKEACTLHHLPLSNQPNVGEYAALDSRLHLSECEVGLTMWQPAPRLVQPLSSWQSGANASPDWYRDYNRVKHNRATLFHLASLDNVLHAIGAVFVLLAQLGAFERHPGGHTHPDDRVVEYWYEGLPFTLRAPR
jgi:hypothetical protein